jgi:uncharacterized protein YndB with AHSA1/START domain
MTIWRAQVEVASVDDNSTHVLTISREYPHPLGVVWEACTKPEALARWFGPEHAPATSFVADVRPGGQWRACLHVGESRAPLYVSGRYLAIDPRARLVYSFRWEGANHEDGPGTDTEVTMTFEALSVRRTRITLRQVGLRSTPSQRGHEQGWESCLLRLESYLGR